MINELVDSNKEHEFQSAKAALITQSIKRAIDKEMGLFEVNVVIYDDRNDDIEGIHIKHLSAGLVEKGEVNGLSLIDGELNPSHGHHLTVNIIQAKEIIDHKQIKVLRDLLGNDEECANIIKAKIEEYWQRPWKSINFDSEIQDIVDTRSPGLSL